MGTPATKSTAIVMISALRAAARTEGTPRDLTVSAWPSALRKDAGMALFPIRLTVAAHRATHQRLPHAGMGSQEARTARVLSAALRKT